MLLKKYCRHHTNKIYTQTRSLQLKKKQNKALFVSHSFSSVNFVHLLKHISLMFEM